MSPLALVVLLLGADTPHAAPPPAARAEARASSPAAAEAESLRAKLKTIELRAAQPVPRGKRPPAPKPVLVTQSELNSYLTLAVKMPRGVTDVDVALERGDAVSARGMVDLDEVKSHVKVSPWSPLALLGGRVPVELRGRLRTGDGFGTVEVEDARVASFSVPPSMVAQILASSTRSEEHPEGIDLNAPFRLPYNVTRVRLEDGRAWLDLK